MSQIRLAEEMVASRSRILLRRDGSGLRPRRPSEHDLVNALGLSHDECKRIREFIRRHARRATQERAESDRIDEKKHYDVQPRNCMQFYHFNLKTMCNAHAAFSRPYERIEKSLEEQLHMFFSVPVEQVDEDDDIYPDLEARIRSRDGKGRVIDDYVSHEE